MRILEVCEFSFEYSALDPDKLKFIQSAFKGGSALITDEGGRKEIPIADLKEFDQLLEIVNIPQSLKISSVVKGMGPMMEKEGLLEFVVEVPHGVEIQTEDDSGRAPALKVGSPEAKKQHDLKVEQVKKLMDTIENGSENRQKASNVVEEMLDLGRSGQFGTKGVESIINEITQHGSLPAMKAIAGLRGSDQTYAHCVDMSIILQGAYEDILKRLDRPVNDAVNRFTLLSGFMHDIGKSEVPKEILESTKRFAPDSQEMLLLRNHTTYGARILSEMGLHDSIINVANYHHVKKDADLFTSYPDVPYENVKPLTRLASIVDVYQALIGKRKYKKNWVPGKAVEYVVNLKGSEFDERMIDHFVISLGKYPVGSLVKLSTGELAFVLAIAPIEFPDRPLVAVVENAGGELLTHHTVLDLMLDKDISVNEVIDHYEHFAESEDQAYKIFQSIRIA